MIVSFFLRMQFFVYNYHICGIHGPPWHLFTFFLHEIAYGQQSRYTAYPVRPDCPDRQLLLVGVACDLSSLLHSGYSPPLENMEQFHRF